MYWSRKSLKKSGSGQIKKSSYTGIRGLQRDVVYLGWPIVPSYMSPNAGGGGELRCLSLWVQLHTGAQINFGDLTLYSTYGRDASSVGQNSSIDCLGISQGLFFMSSSKSLLSSGSGVNSDFVFSWDLTFINGLPWPWELRHQQRSY